MKRFLAVVLLASLWFSTFARPMGYYHLEKVRSSLTLYERSQEWLRAYKTHLEDSARAVSRQVNLYYLEIYSSHSTDSLYWEKMRQQLNDKRMAASEADYYAAKAYSIESRRIEQLLDEKVRTIAGRYRTDRHISLLESYDKVVYCDSCVDYTADLIDYIHTQAKRESFTGDTIVKKDSSATIILKNVSRSNYAYCVAVVRGQLISTRNLKPGHSQSFKVTLPGTSLYKIKISLDKDEEYTYSIEPADYVSQVSSEEVGPGTYEYLIDYDKTQDVISVKFVKVN